MTEGPPGWVPRKRLRALHSIQVRNVACHNTAEELCIYYAVWSHSKTYSGQHEARCLYVSEKVEVRPGCEWLPIDWTASDATFEQLHGVLSGVIHVHLYAIPHQEQNSPNVGQASGPPHPSLETLTVRSRPPKASPLHDSDAERGDVPLSSDATSEDSAGDSAPQSPQAGTGLNSSERLVSEPDNAHFVGFQQFFPAVVRGAQVAEYRLCRAAKGSSPLQDTGQVQDVSLCREPALPGELLLAATLDLEQLDCVGSDWRALGELHAGPLLIAELADGSLCVWPDLPEGYTPPESLDSDRRGVDPLAASSSESDQGKLGGWGGLFRRATIGSASELLARDQSEVSPRNGSSARIASLQNAPSHGQELLQTEVSTGAEESQPQQHTEVSYEALEMSMSQLMAVQQRHSAACIQSRTALCSLDKATQQREAGRQQWRQLTEVATRVGAARLRAQRRARRAAALRGSAAAARNLMQAQCAQMCAALAKLEALLEHLEGPEAARGLALRMDWRALHRKLVARRCRLASDLQTIFGIHPRAVPVVEAPENGFLWHQLDHEWGTVSVAAPRKPSTGRSSAADGDAAADESTGSVAGDSDSGLAHTVSELSATGSQIRSAVRLCISSLALEPSLGRQQSETLSALGWDSEREEGMKAAAALGYAAHVTQALAAYLNVPLKYPLKYANARSAVLERPQAACLHSIGSSEGAAEVADATAAMDPVPAFSLYTDGTDPTRFSYAIFLLNKDVEQLLNIHGLLSVGPSHVLQNLYKLLSAAASAVAQRH